VSFMLLLCKLLLVWLLFLVSAGWAQEDRCLALIEPVKKASFRFLGGDFPWWYNVGVAEVESNCKWVSSSLDGHGSAGYFQLTPKFLDRLLRPYFPRYLEQGHQDHFYAFAFYLSVLHKDNPSSKLWVTYQRYNGGDWVLRECKLAGSFDYDACKNACYRCKQMGGSKCRGYVCVWRVPSGCKQYRHACEINYGYSVKVWKSGQDYRLGSDGKWIFW